MAGTLDFGKFLVFLFVVLCVVVLASTYTMPGAGQVVTRVDNHVELKHGTSARDYLTKNGWSEAWYRDAPGKERLILLRCDVNTNKCAGVILGVRGMAREHLLDAFADPKLELSCYWADQAYWRKTLVAGGFKPLVGM